MRQETVARAFAAIPRGALRFLPGTSRHFGPPRRSASIADYLRQHPGEWRPVQAPSRSAYPPPRALRKDEARLTCQFTGTTWNELGVATIPGGRVLDHQAWPVGRDDTFLFEFAYLGERPICPIFLISKLHPPQRIKGNALNLGSCWASLNYGHFVLDALPRLDLFLRAGLRLQDVDWIVIPNFQGPSAERLIERLGLPRAKLLRPQPGEQYAFDVLFQPSYPGASAYYHPLIPEFYRGIAARSGVKASQNRRRLYIPRRGGTRRISNEAEIERVLLERGFETVDFRKISDDAALFAGADVVVGPHGAGLANVVFCPPGGKLLELIPSNHVFPFYYSAASAAGLDYWGLIGPAEGPELTHDFAPPSDSDFRIEPAELEAVLTAMNVTREVATK